MTRSVFLLFVILSATFNFTKSTPIQPVYILDDSKAKAMSAKVRVLCGAVMSLGVDVNDDPPSQSIADTWGKRCNKILFMNEPDSISSLPPLWKDQHHLRYMYAKKKYTDWFLLTTSAESYVVVENLRYMLADHDPNDAIFFMLTVTEKANVTYVLSKKAVDIFLNAEIQLNICETIKDDIVARVNCFRAIGLKRKSTQDYLRRDRFLAGNVYNRNSTGDFWACRNLPEQPRDCYSDFAISMDGVDTDMKYVIDYLIYTLEPYGIRFGGKSPRTLKQKSKSQPKDDDTGLVYTDIVNSTSSEARPGRTPHSK